MMFCFLFLLSFPILTSANDGGPFDYLMFTTIYPTAVCRADDDSVPDSCEIPKGTPQWTIHGLWPNYENGSYPQFCPGTPSRFDENLIKPIEPKLLAVWPNLFPHKSIQSFWKHEYEKHGTCAQSDERYKNELLYFSNSIKAYETFNIASALSSIGPSDKLITKEQLHNALLEVTNGKSYQIHCLRDKKTKQYLLGDIRLCLNKDLTIRDCPDDRNSNRVHTRFPRRASNGGGLPTYQECPHSFVYISAETSYTPRGLFAPLWDKIFG
ncbi:unnamed protein product [Caenorhabditis angaria]|uniref:Uncharacterized protein n=1 Tax=Caenorhabditis angaria TaxID=860376 RepID=A0A9P1IVB1_9PELO|nr:unnamed protein product [Caenorhabditis angaria]